MKPKFWSFTNIAAGILAWCFVMLIVYAGLSIVGSAALWQFWHPLQTADEYYLRAWRAFFAIAGLFALGVFKVNDR